MCCSRMWTYVLPAWMALFIASGACTLNRNPLPNGSGGDDMPPDPDGDASIDATAPDGGEPDALLHGPLAARAARLSLRQPAIGATLAADSLIAWHEESGASVIDLAEPRSPSVLATLTTVGRIVGAQYDPERRVLFVLTGSGDLRAFRMTDPSAPERIGAVEIAGLDDDAPALEFARVSDRLLVLASDRVIPIDVRYESNGRVGFTQGDSVAIEAGARAIIASGGRVFIAYPDGRLLGASDALAFAEFDRFGGALGVWSVRGQQIAAAITGRGLELLRLRLRLPDAAPETALDSDALEPLASASALDDVVGLASEGALLAVALERGTVAVLDVSAQATPRAVASYPAQDGGWLALARGNLVVGSGRSIEIVGVPAVIEAGIPRTLQGAMPQYSRLALRMSRALDPSSVTLETVVLRCDGRVLPTAPQLSLDARTLYVLPAGPLPLGQTCALSLRGVRDELRHAINTPDTALAFTVSPTSQGAVQNGPSAEPHTADGRMTGWSADATRFEYADIERVQSYLADVVIDFDGRQLWLHLDALGLRDVLDPDCYAVVSGFAGGGNARFAVQVFGDQRVVATGVGLSEVSGGYAHGPSRGSATAHAGFELALAVPAGSFGLHAHLPSDSAGCAERRMDPIELRGMCSSIGCSLDPTGRVLVPAEPIELAPSITSDTTPTLTFRALDALATLAEHAVTIAAHTGDGDAGDQGRTLLRTTAYTTRLSVPPGVLSRGERYLVTIVAHNPAGRSPPATLDLRVVAPSGCAHSECEQGPALSLACSGCADDVCSELPRCCQASSRWDAACVALAAQHCACDE